ncbi:MAG: S8/S53 family peptidase [Rhodospirillaceae bacterium]|nr:S8/S53 family peptidase [Rhodospirillaceae bacterium]
MADDTQDAWNLKAINQPAALRLLPKRSDKSIDWGDVRVAHLDTGYTPHPAYGGWSPATVGGIKAERNDAGIVLAEAGQNFFDPGTSPYGAYPRDPLFDPPLSIVQEAGHGTRTGTALSGIVGLQAIAPGLPIVPYRVNDSSLISARAAQAIGDAIRHAIDRNHCQVISISLGLPVVPDAAMGRAVDYAYENGVIVVAAGGQETNKFCYPAKHRRAIGVAGVTRDHRQYYPYQSYARVDVWAPADVVWRGHVRKPDKYRPGDPLPDTSFSYGNGDGTSYATPAVAAAAVIWLRLHGPTIDRLYATADEPWRRVEAFRRILRQGRSFDNPVTVTLPFKSPGNNAAGMLDLRRFLDPKGSSKWPVPDWPKMQTLEKELDFAGDDAV